MDRSEKACLAELASIAAREGDILRLAFKNGSSKVYANRPAECERGDDGCIEYQLTGYFPKHGLVLLQIGYFEGAEWMLVRLDNGKETKIVIPPHYSPHEKWLVSVCSSMGPAGCGNGIDVVPTLPDATLREWHYQVPDNDDALYEFAGWDGDERVKLVVTFRVGEEMKAFPALVDFIAGRWRLKLPREHRSLAPASSEKP